MTEVLNPDVMMVNANKCGNFFAVSFIVLLVVSLIIKRPWFKRCWWIIRLEVAMIGIMALAVMWISAGAALADVMGVLSLRWIGSESVALFHIVFTYGLTVGIALVAAKRAAICIWKENPVPSEDSS